MCRLWSRDLDESKGKLSTFEPLVIDRLRGVLIVPIRRNQATRPTLRITPRTNALTNSTKSSSYSVSLFMTRWNRLRRDLEASLLELAEKKRYSSYRNISLAMAHHEHATQRIGQLHCLNDAKSMIWTV